MINLTYLALELNSPALYCTIAVYITKVASSLGLLEDAAFILLEVYSKVEELGLIGCAPTVLKGLSSLALHVHETDIAKRFEMKIVESSWFLNQTCSELMAYERLGYIFFLQNNLRQAKIYHDKANQGQGESRDHFLLKGCVHFVRESTQEKLMDLKNYNVNWLWFSYWGLTEEFFDDSKV